MKGITAINAVIILVIGVITIIAIMGLFMSVWTPAKGGTSLQAATQVTCSRITTMGCPPRPGSLMDYSGIYVDGFDANQDGVINPGNSATTGCATNEACDNLYILCVRQYGCVWDNNNYGSNFMNCCQKRICGCS